MPADDPPVVVEETYRADVDTVWKAITEPDRMRRWYFDNIPDFRAEVGFETQFLISNGGRDFPHRWKVTEVIPRKRLIYDWKYDGYAGEAFVVFELSEATPGTRLRLSCIVRRDFPQDVPEFRRESCAQGWEYFIRQSLKHYLEAV